MVLRVGSQEDLRVRVDDEHLLSEGRVIRVEGEEGTASLEDTKDGQNLRDTVFETDSDGPTPCWLNIRARQLALELS